MHIFSFSKFIKVNSAIFALSNTAVYTIYFFSELFLHTSCIAQLNLVSFRDPRESADLISHLEKIVPMTPIDDGDDEDEDLGRGGARQKRSPRGRSRGGYGRRRRRGNGGAALLAGLALGALALGGLGLLAAATTTTGTAATRGTTAVLVPTGK